MTETNREQLLGKWLWILFWLIVPIVIAGIMNSDTIVSLSSGVYLAGRVLNAACSVAYGVVLLILASAEGRYRIAGICSLVVTASNIAVMLIPAASGSTLLSAVITLPIMIINLAGQYNEFKAHSGVLVGVDFILSGKWMRLWKWYIGCTVAAYASVAIALGAPLFGSLLAICAVIGIVIVSIIKLVYLYKTAMVFRRTGKNT